MKTEAEIVLWVHRSTATGEAVLPILVQAAIEKGGCDELGLRDAGLTDRRLFNHEAKP